ncbi:YhgE/Pip domain-containing protein [Bacillus selenatarsenatis]|uniref:YhgE/Pip domain-containing protein n=2 Tax=Mesobacillus selenatarsenatis TaxID=388741 RepID=A0A846TLQ3_9BACI|nr:YhgE/Pip domain-containing protein [Mesobacillus selenatarsenatis]NKE06874.1 YhgE/Pip domain-containing protein [Mesobacillus selenatarsenatis]
MMRKNKIIPVALASIIILPSFLSYGAAAETAGKITSKDEVVYATLKSNGDLDDIFVVNTLEVAKAGKILDYGLYSSVKNLTDLSELDQKGQAVTINAPEGKFYYQGNMEDNTELPWDIEISYLLDGREVEASELAGKEGNVEIKIQTAANEKADSVYFENYLLQISLQLSNSYQNIEAEGGMVANAGKNKQITFTVMPGQEEEFTVEAEVENFEFTGVDIAAVPSTLPIDTSEMESMTDDMSALSDAIKELNDGVADLKSGVSQLNNGAASLRDGSAKYKNGVMELNGSSSQIVGASSSIGDALKQISTSLSGDSAQMDVASLSELPAVLTQLASGMNQAADGLTTLRENYAKAYGALDGAIKGIPAHEVSEKEIEALYSSGADASVVNKLVESYAAAQKVKGTYSQVQEAFAAVDPSLKQVSGSVTEMSSGLTAIAGELSASLKDMDMSGLEQLQKGLTELSSKYGEFHSGLVGYTGGVSKLAASYNQLHSGIASLADGTGELNDGVEQLHNGTSELHQETKNLPEQMKQEINEMIKEYDKSDFEPVSFVSTKNEKVTSVQFVIKTEAIEKEEPEEKKAKPEKKKGFWDLLMELF